jgi:hypothetical protein
MSSFFAFWLFIVGGIILVLILKSHSQSVLNESLSDLAKRTGLMFEPGKLFGHFPAIFGTYRQHQIKLDFYERYCGNGVFISYTRIVVILNRPNSLSMTLHRAGILSRIGNLLWTKVQVGDEELDRRFIIRGQPENKIRRVVNSPEICKRLLLNFAFDIKVKNQEIYYTAVSSRVVVDALIEVFDLLCAVGDAIDASQD